MMVRFVGVAAMARWVASAGPATVIANLLPYVEDDFRRWERFDKSARTASHTPFGVIELMPTSDFELYGFKFVNGHPSNPGRGYQTVTAFGALADVHNGYPRLLSEMTLLTALRTAATSAMVAKHLARPDSAVMALIGCGSQAEFQALGMREALGIETLRLWDTDPEAMQTVERNLAPLGFDVTITSGVADAVRGADVITTCTADKTRAVVLDDALVAPGVHINAVGGDCPGKTELDPAILDRGRVFVEFPPQTRIEGEIQLKDPEFPVTEVWKVIAGHVTGRQSPEDITIFDSVGFAIEDFSALRFLDVAIDGTEFFDEIDLIAAPDDPKDLFSLVGAPLPVA